MQRVETVREAWEEALGRVGRGVHVAIEHDGPPRVVESPGGETPDRVAFIPPCPIDRLGDASFRQAHGVRYACLAGAMANGIASVELVEAMGRAGMLGIFGAAGLGVDAVEKAVDRIQGSLGDKAPYGFNLIHSPQEPAIESAVVDLYLRKQVRLVEASAFLNLTPPVVRYRVAGIHRDERGRVVVPNRIIAKASRVEVAQRFLAPPPEKILRTLVEQGAITAEQAAMAATIPMADDLTAEADSGGHTDNQPLVILLPTFLALRDRMAAQYGYDRRLRIGAAGGISTPWAAAGALAMGAGYLVTGSVNQACVEAGTSDVVRTMLSQAQQADIAMAPAADMFEMGVKVQVLKRGTMFAMRAAKLYEYYRAYDRLESIPDADRATLEKTLFRIPLPEVWEQTRAFFARRDPAQIAKAEADAKYKMALVFRWYLGQSSHWANVGEPSRAVDYQIWCGPAMAAFNDWTRGTFLEKPENRRAADVALNLLHNAAVLLRARTAAMQGVVVPDGSPRLAPLPREEIEKLGSDL
ncbi:PfaD family polyunsaturated fatty acid/polyketide biosynthesis protein [Planctomyces sp. SH-PL62]|uniref:PfaD family polyunsaturated fatty acid/polyketide biosynthesis protein n=1 Tax=Planctomyces sp. SH-PL62 TaxID=1636152 RepID=UPI00078D2E5C|nr:PfaD family polyunsaturated fatty acid/polyketide biosynthesis protein [Planctomyces sp. SH-PL62]AMV37012.1 Polyketide biosynthesis protein PksE [Planctomyces sp. SH-PL62]